MAKGKNTFTAYIDWLHIFEELSDKDAGKLVKHILNYVNDNDPKTEDPLIKVAFAPIKNVLKKDLKKWESACKRNKEAAKKRWDANACERIQVDADASERMQMDAKHADNDNDKDNDKEVTTTPTVDVFVDYAKKVCGELEIYVSPVTIKNKYYQWSENDWRCGYDKPIKNWKKLLRKTLPHLKESRPAKSLYGL